MSLSDRFKIVRENLGLSQKDMAKALDISLPSLQGYEAARSVPGGNVFEALVKLGFNANWLLTGEGEMKREEGIKAFDLVIKKQNGNLLVCEAKNHYDKEQSHAWLHEWIEEELQGKSISEVMAVAVKIKTVLDESKEG